MAGLRRFQAYIAQVGRPGSEVFKAREDLKVIEASSAFTALDALVSELEAAGLGAGIRRVGYSIPVLGVGSIKVDELELEVPA